MRVRSLRGRNDACQLVVAQEMAAASVRNILRMHGLPEDALDGLPPYEVLAHVKALRLARELESKPVEERERILREFERESEERGRRRDS